MKALNEQKQVLQDIEEPIGKMSAEIELLRNINYRYYLKHGNSIQNGVVEVPRHISFSLSGKIDSAECAVIDYEKLGLTSNYLNIKNEMQKLS